MSSSKSGDSSESNSISDGMKGYEAVLQSFIDKGEASTPKEARKVFSRKGYEATLQGLVESGEVSTLEEARKVFSRKGYEATLQGLVKNGEASTPEEARKVFSEKAYEAVLRALIDKKEASTLEEARKVLSRIATEARNDKYTQRGIRDISSKAANIAHKKKGNHVKYSGVHFDKQSQKWRLQISYKGTRISAGLYRTEVEAARAHDDYVRKHGLDRPLHFPTEEERARDEAIPRLKQ